MRRRKFQEVLMAMAALVVCLPAHGQGSEPMKDEMAEAYRSKMFGRMEVRRINEVRGWKLKFKRLRTDKNIGMRVLRYQAVAKKDGWCAEYQIVDFIPIGHSMPRMKARLDVEPQGVRACR